MNKIWPVFSGFHRGVVFIAGLFLIAMILLTSANIVFRLFGNPINGTFELMGFFGAITASFALGYTQLKNGHIAVDILINFFSPGVRRILHLLNNCICLVFFVVVAWQLSEKAGVLRETGEVTETLRIIYYPFTYGAAFGCLVLSCVFFSEIIKTLFPDMEKEVK